MRLAKKEIGLSDVLEDTMRDVWGHWEFRVVQHHPLSPDDYSQCPTALFAHKSGPLDHSHLITSSGVSVANLIVALVTSSCVHTESSVGYSPRLATSSPALNHPELFHLLLGLGPLPLTGFVRALFQGESMRSRMINCLVVDQLGWQGVCVWNHWTSCLMTLMSHLCVKTIWWRSGVAKVLNGNDWEW